MGCFLACFGYSNKRRKRRKSSIRILCEDHASPLGHGSYETLQPEVVPLNITEDPIKDKPKDSLSSKIRKKVSFNLNVKMYEPIPNDETADCFPVFNEIKTWEKSGEVMEKSKSNHGDEGNSIGSEMVYPANYRYQNISGSYDEEEDIRFEESDLDDDDDYDADTDEEDSWESKDEEDDVWKINEFEFIEQFYSQNGSTKDNVSNAPVPAEGKDNCRPLVEDLKTFQGNCSARDRSQYVHPVLNPVANLSQWKVVKSKSVSSIMYQKENVPCQEPQRCFQVTPNFNQLLPGSISDSNISKPLMQDKIVVTSLANWLASPEN
ncbi:Pheromone-processing carboxypeptidase KEX [Heracleum sosnowskyi]|uniref:Pheromone-processing carboxypeptidase KEX n=1 Tax=Heracleum sosnowskyi TaxID=360622 RepID=A0AAD8J0B5_9APIA|nr:Pheromone-processing carboxypeptidase KEX [Heracleum sosnowskyi]